MGTEYPTRLGVRRRGAAAVAVVVSLVVLLGFAALSIDLGHLYLTRAELQRTADAAALAGATSGLASASAFAGGLLSVIIRVPTPQLQFVPP